MEGLGFRVWGLGLMVDGLVFRIGASRQVEYVLPPTNQRVRLEALRPECVPVRCSLLHARREALHPKFVAVCCSVLHSHLQARHPVLVWGRAEKRQLYYPLS